jgi:hypothetical protein
VSTRPLPRRFEFPWGGGEIVEEVSCTTEWHEPTIQLLRYDDGGESIRFCSYTHEGRFQRQPLVVGGKDLAKLGAALRHSPRLRKLLEPFAASAVGDSSG